MNKFKIDKNYIYVNGKENEISFPLDGHKSLIKIENESFWFKHRNEVIKKIIVRFQFNGDLVDIGGGNGYQIVEMTRLNPHNKNILVEPGYSGCLIAKTRGVELVYNSVFQDFNFEEFNVSAVTLFDVLEHVENDIDFLSDLISKLRPGTKLYLTLPAHDYLWSDVDNFGGHYRRYNKKMIQKLSKKLDLKIEFFTYFFSYLLPISFIIRSIPYKLGFRKNDEEILKDENKHHNSNFLLSLVFSIFEKIELLVLKKLSIPFGASCLVVFEKK